ncbi:flagellar biosynthesis protein FliS [Photobacterium damselae]|uniref:flagellar biosynthesis protein FliS n=1 Tax=Photobacterium damselae TaxID=38293 RepID=UPI002542F442|nr:flagellar biosynthesis protein FliS [Photobacterium damselae]WIH18742.1 flagellar biosynthesis protein FliS [Photobacterium damselae]
MESLITIEQQINELLVSESYADDFPEQLERLVAARHQQVEHLLKATDLNRATYDDVVARTQAMKTLLQQYKSIIGERLLKSKRSKQSLSVYNNIQQNRDITRG